MSDPNPNWLAADDWRWVQDTVPVACVDVLPVRVAVDGTVTAVGLIYRDTPHQGRRWCLVGGRLYRGETFADAAARQLRETLGPAVAFDLVGPHRQPDYVTQYFPTARPGGLVDPRQHAVTAVFVVPLTGDDIVPTGEADDFRWFAPGDLPPAAAWGFGQDAVAAACLRQR